MNSQFKKQYISFTILEGIILLLFTSLSISCIIKFLFIILNYFLLIEKKANLLFIQKNFVSCYMHSDIINNYNKDYSKEQLCLDIIMHNTCQINKISSQSVNGNKFTNQLRLICHQQEKIMNLIVWE